MRSIARSSKRGVWLVAFLFAAILCQAQEFCAKLTGQVSDLSGALIPGTKITATTTDSGRVYRGVATGKGVYYINYVLLGVYAVPS